MSDSAFSIMISLVAITVSAAAMLLARAKLKEMNAAKAERLAAESPAKREMRARHEAIVQANKRRLWRRP